MIPFDAVILAGGRGVRLGGVDKPALLLGASTPLGRAIAAVASAPTVVVGPTRPAVPAGVRQVLEDPPLAGPAAALAAGLDALDRGRTASAYTLVLAADLPAAVPAVRELLRCADAGPADAGPVADGPAADGWVATDPDGRRQYLLALYRTTALAEVCRRTAEQRGTLVGAPMRRVVERMRLAEIPLPAELTADIDTPGDLAAALERERSTDGVPA